MVLPLRFPPGMAGGLLLAYPRIEEIASKYIKENIKARLN